MDYYTTFQTPLGLLGLLASNKALKQVFWNISPNYRPISPVSSSKSSILKKAEKQLKEYFQGIRKQFSVPLDLEQGTDFQRKAWQVLQQIPYGKTISYQRQAEIMRCPKGYRSVGNANGKNPIPIIIPCHRVIPKHKLDVSYKTTNTIPLKIGGFTGGVEKKAFLLKLERARPQYVSDHSD